MTRLASVYPLVTARSVARAFTYEVPDEVERGAIVDVRFGNARRLDRGLFPEAPPVPEKPMAWFAYRKSYSIFT